MVEILRPKSDQGAPEIRVPRLCHQAYNSPAMSAIDDLLHEIFDSRQTPLAREFEGWLRGSRRYQAFAAAYRAKIRAKLRNAHPDGGLADVRAELETAALLLGEEQFAVAYETYAARKQRGPDFTVTFRTHTPFNVEVRRVRGGEEEDDEARAARLAAVLLDKVGQMPPGIANLLWLIVDEEIAAEDVDSAAVGLVRAAERKEEEFFTRRGFDSAADFLRQYARLSAVALRRPSEIALSLNPLARHKLPPAIAAAIERIHPDR